MHVAIIHIRLTQKGGLETRVINYMNYFLERGNQVTIITSKISGALSIPAEVNIIQVPLSRYPKFLRMLFFNFKLMKLMPHLEFDYVLSLERTWVQDNLIAPNTHIGYLRAQKKIWRSPSDILQLYLDKRSFNTVKNIYACSEMVKAEIVSEYKIPEKKIHVVYPPLRSETFNTQHRIHRKKMQVQLGIDPTKTNFLFVSTSHKRKGIDLLLSIFRSPQFASKHLYIAGSDFTPPTPNIHLLGYISSLQDWYISIDALLHPAVYEPFGQIVSEALACGTYVMVSSKSGASEIIQNDAMGLILPSDDYKAWERAILQYDSHNPIPTVYSNHIASSLNINMHMKQLLATGECFLDNTHNTLPPV